MRAMLPTLRRGSVCACLLLAALAAPSVPAREPLGPLDLQLRAIQAPDAAGTADLELVLQAFVAVRDLQLSVRRSDGTPGAPATEALEGVLPRGDFSLRAGDRARTTFQAVFPRAGVYEVVVKASGVGESGPVSTETMARIVVGTPLTGPTQRDGVAEFEVTP